MPDFSKLLNAPSGKAERPKALPAGDYPAVIRGYELGESREKKTPYVRFTVVPQGFPEGVEPDGIDLSKKSLRRDYFFTEDALYRLDEFIESCGAELGRPYGEIFPELTGRTVIASVTQRTGDSGGTAEVFNDVAKLVGV